MQESRLRRDRYGQLCSCQQNGLAQLPIPRAIAELAALECRQLKFAGAQIGDEIGGGQRLGARGGFANRSDRNPDIVVEGTHWPIGKAQKAVLKLRGAPLLERRMPARCHQALRSRYRARIPSAEGQIVAELTVLVGDHEHVIVGHVLAEERNLFLDLLVPAIRATVSGIKVEAALLHDLAAEA